MGRPKQVRNSTLRGAENIPQPNVPAGILSRLTARNTPSAASARRPVLPGTCSRSPITGENNVSIESDQKEAA